MNERVFYFAADNKDILEEWTIYMEFIKAKAIYDEFVTNFVKIQFPIGTYLDHYDITLRLEISNIMTRTTLS
jgi:adenylate cyclase 10